MRGAIGNLSFGLLPVILLLLPDPSLLSQLVIGLACALASVHGWGSLCNYLLHRHLSLPIATRSAIGFALVAVAASATASVDCLHITVQQVILHIGIASNAFVFVARGKNHAAAQTNSSPGPLLLLLALSALVVMTALAQAVIGSTYPFDDSGNWFATIARLRDTGGFDDPIGYHRHSQLGGWSALSTLIPYLQDVRLAGLVEGVAFILFIGLFASGHPRSSSRAVVQALLIISFCSKAWSEIDPTPFWSLALLCLLLFRLISASTASGSWWLQFILTNAALVCIRQEFVSLFVAALVIGLVCKRYSVKAAGLAILSTMLLVAPLLIDRIANGERAKYFTMAHLLTFVVASVVWLTITTAIFPRSTPQQRWLTRGIAFGSAALWSGMFGTAISSRSLIWPLLVAALVVLAEVIFPSDGAEPADPVEPALPTVLGATLVVVLLILITRSDTSARFTWKGRVLRWLNVAQQLASSTEYRKTENYAELLKNIPGNSRVLVYVSRPEQLPFSQHRLFDLRINKLKTLRRHAWDGPNSATTKAWNAAVNTSNARYLLFQEDDHRQLNSSWYFSSLCPPADDEELFAGRPLVCLDFLETVVATHLLVARLNNLVLVDLSQPNSP